MCPGAHGYREGLEPAPPNPALPFTVLHPRLCLLLTSQCLLLLFFSFLFSLKALAPQGWILDGLFA